MSLLILFGGVFAVSAFLWILARREEKEIRDGVKKEARNKPTPL